MSPPEVNLKNETLKLLVEQDSEDEEKEFEEFKYLGVHMPHNGSWKEFVETKKTKTKRCQQALGRFWNFFRCSNIGVRLKIRIANLISGHGRWYNYT